jgi:hypothetical protein
MGKLWKNKSKPKSKVTALHATLKKSAIYGVELPLSIERTPELQMNWLEE